MSSVEMSKSARRVVLLVAVLLAFESVMYSVVTPVLALYAREFGASKTAIGWLAASYPAGLLPGSLLGGWIATRAGVRRTTLLGLVLFTVAVAPFGFASSIAVLTGLRFIQGIASGCIWSAALAWVIAVAVQARRGEVLGSVLASAVYGMLVGTIIGTVADAIGTRIVFVCLGVLSLGLITWTARFREPRRTSLGGSAPLRALASSRQFRLGFWLVMLIGLVVGVANALLPLRLARFGASDVEIGVTFLLAMLVGALVTPGVGRVVDRRGILLPLIAALVASGLLIGTVPLPHNTIGLAVLIVLGLGAPYVGIQMGGISMITDAVEWVGAAVAIGTMLFNLAYALGETVGAPVAATLSRATSDTVPLVLLAAVTLLTILPVLLTRPRHGTAPEDSGKPAQVAP